MVDSVEEELLELLEQLLEVLEGLPPGTPEEEAEEAAMVDSLRIKLASCGN